jgi:hypothetical protein
MSPQRKSRLVLVSILGLCILPILLAQGAWQWAKPQGGKTYGQLLAQPLLDAPLTRSWRLLAHSAQGCDGPNREYSELLLTAQQLQRAQGRYQDRLSVSGCLTLAREMPSGVYLIDPNGNAVLRYLPLHLRDEAGRQAALREIAKVLKNNQGLG